MKITKQRRDVLAWFTVQEFAFIYFNDEDRGKFSLSVLRGLHKAGILYRLHAGSDHDNDCYELTNKGRELARSIGLE